MFKYARYFAKRHLRVFENEKVATISLAVEPDDGGDSDEAQAEGTAVENSAQRHPSASVPASHPGPQGPQGDRSDGNRRVRRSHSHRARFVVDTGAEASTAVSSDDGPSTAYNSTNSPPVSASASPLRREWNWEQSQEVESGRRMGRAKGIRAGKRSSIRQPHFEGLRTAPSAETLTEEDEDRYAERQSADHMV